jgi:hypothetical protein
MPFYPISQMLRQLLGNTPKSEELPMLAGRLTAVGLKPVEAISPIAPLLNL